jgi:hypothetical protein
MSSGYIPQIILACAFTSISIHLINQRRGMEAEKRRSSAQITALEDVLRRLRAGETVSDAEMAKMRRRVGLLNHNSTDRNSSMIDSDATASESTSQKGMTAWKEAIMGKSGANVTEEQALSEWNKGQYVIIAHVHLFLNFGVKPSKTALQKSRMAKLRRSSHKE